MCGCILNKLILHLIKWFVLNAQVIKQLSLNIYFITINTLKLRIASRNEALNEQIIITKYLVRQGLKWKVLM